MVLPVDLWISPVICMEPGHLLLLRIVEDSVGAGSCWRVVEDVWQQGLVHLEQWNLLQFYSFWFCLVKYLSFIKTTENKENVGAKSLSDFSFVTEQTCQTVNQEAIGKKLSNSHQTHKPLILEKSEKFYLILDNLHLTCLQSSCPQSNPEVLPYWLLQQQVQVNWQVLFWKNDLDEFKIAP